MKYSARQRVYDVLESTPRDVRGGLIANRSIGFLIVVSVASTALETVPQLRAKYGSLFDVIEALSLSIFSIEYVLRIWIAPEHVPSRDLKVWASRLAYIRSAQGMLDLAAIAPLWIAPFGLGDLRILIVLRILRVLKFNRYSSGMSSLLEVLWGERRALSGCLVVLVCAALVAASAMHVIEGSVQPDRFGTIPDAMWWAIVTLSTIGYGDVVPATALGKIVAAITIVAGLVMIALPVGIVATAFSEVIHKRDFIVTWSMVARVPLFSGLTAGDIAHIMQLLRARRVERGQIITRRGEPADSLYFIMEGEVEIELGEDQKQRRVTLGAGHFFGERAVLRKSKRSATVTSLTRTKLLALDAADLRALIARDAAIAAHINKVALGRGAREAPIGDDGAEGNGDAAFAGSEGL